MNGNSTILLEVGLGVGLFTGMILLVLANLFTFMTFEMEGREQTSNLISGSIEFWRAGYWELAALVFLSSICLPFVSLALTLYLLTAFRLGFKPWHAARVLRWILGRCKGEAEAVETPIGWVPAEGSLDLRGIEDQVDAATLEGLLRVDPNDWAAELDNQKEFFEKFGEHTPEEIWAQLAATKERLGL